MIIPLSLCIPPKIDGVLLGIDPGKKFVGLALSDPHRMVATPLTRMGTKVFRRAGENLRLLLQEHKVNGIVMGYPLTMKGVVGKQAQWVRQLTKDIEKALNIPIMLQDERRTTASIIAIAGDISRYHQDLCAATLILQTFLDKQRFAQKA